MPTKHSPLEKYNHQQYLRQSRLLLQDKKIDTKPDLNLKDWTDQGIFKHSGIKTEDDKYFKNMTKKRCDNPEKYGYRLGTEEAGRLNLAQQPQSTFAIDMQRRALRQKPTIQNGNTFFGNNESKRGERQQMPANVEHKSKCCNLL